MAGAARAPGPAKAARPDRPRAEKVLLHSRATANGAVNGAVNAVPAARAGRVAVAVLRTAVKRARAASFGQVAKAAKGASPVRARSPGRPTRRARVADPAAPDAGVERRPSRSSRFPFTPSSW